MLLGSAYLWSRFPSRWWQVTRWSKDGRRWPRDEKRRKFPTSFQHLRERPPSWQSGPDQVSANRCTSFDANTNTAWTKHNTLTVLPILQLQVFHYWGKTSWHCLFDFSADDCDLMQLVSQHKYKYCLDQYNTLTVPFILLLQVLHRSKTSWHGLCDFSTDDCDLMHFVSPSSQHLTCKKI